MTITMAVVLAVSAFVVMRAAAQFATGVAAGWREAAPAGVVPPRTPIAALSKAVGRSTLRTWSRELEQSAVRARSEIADECCKAVSAAAAEHVLCTGATPLPNGVLLSLSDGGQLLVATPDTNVRGVLRRLADAGGLRLTGASRRGDTIGLRFRDPEGYRLQVTATTATVLPAPHVTHE